MKRIFAWIGCFLLLFALFGCEQKMPAGTESDSVSDESAESSSLPSMPDPNAAAVWTDACADESAGLASASDIYRLSHYVDGKESDVSVTGGEDIRLLLRGKNASRFVNYPEGYVLTLPASDVEADLTFGATRTQLKGKAGVLTVTRETENPYDDSQVGWDIYLREWLESQIADLSFLAANRIRYTRQVQIDHEMLPGYEVRLYSMTVGMPGNLRDHPYFQVAIVRKQNVYKECYLLMFRSAEQQHDYFDTIVRSFAEIPREGTPKGTQGQYELRIPQNWNAETKAYYEKLQSQSYTDWGFFTRSMVHSSDPSYQHQCETLTETQSFLQTELAFKPSIMPTYSELTYADVFKPFPREMAETYAGGNGFNGKPVLQFTFHMAANASEQGQVAEIYNVLRGTREKQLRQLANDIKAYGHPVLFRLNNEMNGSWTSYSCTYLMLDTDLFVEAWRYLYDLFQEEGVDNCIWIWNPIAVDAPYGNYNEHIHYFPGSEYVQLIGLTYYEMNNESFLLSFKEMYTELYEKNIPYFENFPWALGEFGCAAGGERKINWDTGLYDETELGRNRSAQAEWVRGMFACMNHKDDPANAFCARIKTAVWFSQNDYVYLDGQEYITNYLRLDDLLSVTSEQMRLGLAENERLKEADTQ